MLTGQVLVFILTLQTALAMEAYLSEASTELYQVSMLSSMEIASENVMLDCCLRLRAWASENPETTTAIILPLAGEWGEGVEEYLSTRGWSCDLLLEGLTVEPLANQTVDPLQAGFLGSCGDERIFISAMLIVNLETGNLRFEATYPIKIAS
jgi:hypothetical protein